MVTKKVLAEKVQEALEANGVKRAKLEGVTIPGVTE